MINWIQEMSTPALVINCIPTDRPLHADCGPGPEVKKDHSKDADRSRVTAIQSIVAKRLGIAFERMLGPRGTRDLSDARFLAMYLCSELTELNQKEIGSMFNRDHTMIIRARQSVLDRSSIDPKYAALVTSLADACKHL